MQKGRSEKKEQRKFIRQNLSQIGTGNASRGLQESRIMVYKFQIFVPTQFKYYLPPDQIRLPEGMTDPPSLNGTCGATFAPKSFQVNKHRNFSK